MPKTTFHIAALFALTYLLLAPGLISLSFLQNLVFRHYARVQCVQTRDCTNVCSDGGLCNENFKCICWSPNAVINSGPPCWSDEMCFSTCGGNGGYCNYEIGGCYCQ
ncbi:putative defensin-like protein 282 [Capsella rubella]|uniref:putative defensin-like protein 282 n=1 Tax=Capsella rubella TaxID=81985 RepID=UPI000CD547D2|nr:putative defensin-like protein 282 [Capsella rubella]